MTAEKTRKRAYSPEQTRERLLKSGLKLFGQAGYNGVTTRALAADARVNQAAIPYHFGGKEGLYRAVAEMVADDMAGANIMFVTKAPDVFRMVAGNKPIMRKVVRTLVKRMVRRFLGFRDRAGDRPAFIVREYLDPGIGFGILYERVIERVHMALTAMVAVVAGMPEEAPEAKLKAHSILGQIIIFGLARPVMLRRMEWENYSSENIEAIAEVVSDMVVGALNLKET